MSLSFVRFNSLCTVVIGTYTASNWSSPVVGATIQLLLVSTPTISKGCFQIVSVFPVGFEVPNSFCATMLPMTTTCAAFDCSRLVKNRPALNDQERRIEGRSTSEP